MSVTEFAGYLAAFLVFLSFYMKTMVPLRVVGICSNCAFIAYGYLGGLHPVLVLHLILLPLNGVRLHEMLRLIRAVRGASRSDLSMDWLKPFTSTRKFKKADIVFRKGEFAGAMFFVVSGQYRLEELGKDILPGQLVGELGLLVLGQTRTQTLVCAEDGEMLHITYDQLKQLYYQNPQFGFYFMQLAAGRLFENISRLERELAARGGAPAATGAEPSI